MQGIRHGILTLVLLLLLGGVLAPYREIPPAGVRLLAAVGGVGVQIGVLPNEYNQIAQQLAVRETEISIRERLLDQQREALELKAFRNVNAAGYSLAASIVLFILLILNFYFDYRERHRMTGNGLSTSQ